MLRKKVSSIKESIDRKFEGIQLVNIVPASNFVANLLSQDIIARSNIGKSQVSFQDQTNSKISENMLSIHSKAPSP